MGSLGSRPKAPSMQSPQIVYMPAPVTTPDVAVVDEKSEAEQRAELRQQNLLTRGRGRLGTVTTSFRGLLSAINTSGQSKTLLGE